MFLCVRSTSVLEVMPVHPQGSPTLSSSGSPVVSVFLLLLVFFSFPLALSIHLGLIFLFLLIHILIRP